jgi:glycosyltransferase involved in cell wall biosynthesis
MTSPHHLLLVSYHALPRVTPGSLRVEWMASHLARRGWRVTVLTATPEPASIAGVRMISTAAAGGALREAGHPGRLRTLWNDHALPDRHVGWARVLVRHARAIMDATAVDVVLSTSPPHSTHLGVAWLRRGRPFRWVADFRDPWTAPARQPRSPLSSALHRRMEASVLRACDGVIANTDGNRAALHAAFPDLPRGKVRVVENAFDDAMLDAAAVPVTETADLTYVGEVYPGMTDRLVAALARLREQGPDAVPRLAVHGDVDPRERRKIEAAGLGAYVEFRGRVPHAESLRAMQRARSLLLLLPHADNWATCVPSKLYPYLASGRPVLALVPEGDAARIVRESGAGEALSGSDDVAIAAAVGAFVSRVRREGPWPQQRSEVIRRYAAGAQAARLDEMLTGIVGPAR